jgi:DNA-binding XRE family transcriptional regulator
MNDNPNSLAQELEEMENQRDAVTALLASIESANQESIPFEMVERMSAGEAPLTVWREYRCLTAEVLGKKAGVSEADVLAIEAGAEPSLGVAAALAKALDIDAEDLIPYPQE